MRAETADKQVTDPEHAFQEPTCTLNQVTGRIHFSKILKKNVFILKLYTVLYIRWSSSTQKRKPQHFGQLLQQQCSALAHSSLKSPVHMAHVPKEFGTTNYKFVSEKSSVGMDRRAAKSVGK